MNMHVKMNVLDRRYYVKRAGHWEPLVEEEKRWPIWLGIGLPVIAAWALIAGAAWVWLG